MNKNNSKRNNLDDLKKLAFYTTIPFMMAAIIGLGAFLGYNLDKFLSLNYPIFTIILTVLFVLLAIYYAIKDILKYRK